MKKIAQLLLITILLFSNSLVFADKPTTWNEIINIHTGTEMGADAKLATGEYCPIEFYFDIMAQSEDGGKRPIRSSMFLGIAATKPYLPDYSVAELKRFYNALPPRVNTMFKDGVFEALAIDTSQ